jgi:hypothetical protein
MSALAILLLALTASGSPLELEESGRLWEAGAAWAAEGSVSGQSRVICSLLEEALYAGHANRAYRLLLDLESMGVDSRIIDYWYARLAWACGLDSMSTAILSGVEGDDWLAHRSRGTALFYTGMSLEASGEFCLSLRMAATRRQQFYSALDLCTSLLSCGRESDAMQLAGILRAGFPFEGLAALAYAECLEGCGFRGEAILLMDSLSTLQGSSPSIADMASRLLER